jgi:hypothetical protein
LFAVALLCAFQGHEIINVDVQRQCARTYQIVFIKYTSIEATRDAVGNKYLLRWTRGDGTNAMS